MSCLQGYKSTGAYILTQMPMPDTVVDFWRLVYDPNRPPCNTIIMLNALDKSDKVQKVSEISAAFLFS